MDYEAYNSMGEVTPIEEEEPVASPLLTYYYLGSGIPCNRRYVQKTLPTCGGIKKKKPRMRVHSFRNLTRNIHPYHDAFVKPAPYLILEASWKCLGVKPPTSTEEDMVSYLFDRTMRLSHKVESMGGEIHTIGGNGALRAKQIEDM
ncbi:unnamed protein product [Lactuca saligna]|uniref:Uncharacterized protein n=1 Tax=Lactuca saligna TaxID=75948 RepID=A0AA36DYB2_LACSI|nr:unnamed protein product [Lactuca saligna]